MLRIFLTILMISFAQATFGQTATFYSDWTTPLLPQSPCECDNWHNVNITRDTTSKDIYYTQILENTAISVWYLAIINAHITDLCDDPTYCRGAKRIRDSVYTAVYSIVRCNDQIIQPGQDCCNNKIYNSAIEGCCNGQIYYLAKEGCCNDQVYYLSTHACCEGEVVTKSQCCGEKVIKEPQTCCKDQIVTPPQVCCDGQVVPSDICCGGKVMHFPQECCGNQILQPNQECCYDQPVPTGECCKLKTFELPCCVENDTYVKDIALLTFSAGNNCPEDDVVFDPAIISPSKFDAWPLDGVKKITVKAKKKDVELSTDIIVVNKNFSVKGQMQINVKKLLDMYESAMKQFDNGGVAPCKSSGKELPDISWTGEESRLCCPSDPLCVLKSEKYAGNLSWKYGRTCHKPFYGIPYLASVDWTYTFGVSLTIKVNNKTDCNSTKICVGGDGKLEIGGGIGFTLVFGAVSAELQAITSASLNADYCFSPPPQKGTAKFQIGSVKIVGTVSYGWGMLTEKVELVVFSGWGHTYTW